jgi:dGTPase
MQRAKRELEALFEYYLAEPAMLPESHHSRIQCLGLHRVVCDYIAGMTDSFARAQHAQILKLENVEQ